MQGPPLGGSVVGMNNSNGDCRDLWLLLHGYGPLLLLQPLDCYHQHLDLLRKDSKLVLLVHRQRWWSTRLHFLAASIKFPTWLVKVSCAHVTTMTSSFGEQMHAVPLLRLPTQHANLLSSDCSSLSSSDDGRCSSLLQLESKASPRCSAMAVTCKRSLTLGY